MIKFLILQLLGYVYSIKAFTKLTFLLYKQLETTFSCESEE